MTGSIGLFSGQGQQFLGMGQDIYSQESLYRETLAEASDAVHLDLTDPEVMASSDNTQISIVVFSMGIYRVLAHDGLVLTAASGLSLGEYSALIASGMLSFAQTLLFIQDRERYMSEAGEKHPAAMAAVMKADAQLVNEACESARKQGKVYIANYNSPRQIVIGGDQQGIDAAKAYLLAKGVKRIVPVNMSVASHTPLMAEASERLAERIESLPIHSGQFSVISNTINQPFTVSNLKDTLVNQLIKPTHFSENIQSLNAVPHDFFVEIGPGKTLSKFAKQTVSDIETYSVDNIESLNAVRKRIEEGEKAWPNRK